MPRLLVDSPPDVEAVLIERYRAMGDVGRLRAVLALNETLDRLALTGIAQRHGAIDSRELRLRLYALRLDRDDMIRAFGWDPEIEGY